MKRVDLNADVGEGCSSDAALFELVSSANVACGGHAGDEESMTRTVQAALAAGVAIGAHPAFPDREGFGRVAIVRTAQQIFDDVRRQVTALAAIAAAAGARLRHVKPHGALYHLAARDPVVARAVAEAVLAIDPSLLLYGLAGSDGLEVARAAGLRAVGEGFADRAYAPDGTLVPRGEPGASIEDPLVAERQALALVARGSVESICVHGDAPYALALARRLRQGFLHAGFRVEAP
ncbi:MAG TPA: 5-oxoprolinase subunit PxpA [Verrucomicrobiae bacterium]|nr:5-oxoprolinase subunit PxpA [Verrucomicrobiae bacterium]